MRNWLKYLLLFWVLLSSANFVMAQGPYVFTGYNSGQQTASANSGTIVYNNYLTVPLNQGTSLRHIDYDISWHNQGYSSNGNIGYAQYSSVKIKLYNNNNIVQTLETIYEPTTSDGANYYNYTGSLDFNVPIQSGYEIRVVLQAKWTGWTSYVNSATITAITGPLNEILIFEDDFQSSPISPEWSTTAGSLPVPLTYISSNPNHTATLLGEFSNKIIKLDIAGLPTHTAIRIEFDLYIFDSWDGNAGSGDFWKLEIDGSQRINTTFNNKTFANNNSQSYPHNFKFYNPEQDEATTVGLDNLNWSPIGSNKQNCTSIYKINNIVSHSSNDITISLEGLGLQPISDESWGIDNVKVYALGVSCNDDSFCDDFESGSFNTGNWSANSGAESSVVVGTSGSITGIYSAEFSGGSYPGWGLSSPGWVSGSWYSTTSTQAWNSTDHIAEIDMCLDLATVSIGTVVMELDYNSSAWGNYNENSWFRVLVNGSVLADDNGNLDHHLPGLLTLSYDLSTYIGTSPAIILQASCQWDDSGDNDYVFVDNLCVIISDVLGCTDNTACNYDPLANIDDGSCILLDSLVAVPNPACFGDIVMLTAYPSSPLYEYKFKWRVTGTTSWSNISSYGGWLSNNIAQYGSIYQDTDFKVRIRSSIDNSCKTLWNIITVPVNQLPTSVPISHN